jgi:hypothetical protein
MAAGLVIKVLNALDEVEILAETAYPGGKMPNITEARTAVCLQKVDHTQRTATVLVTVMVPVKMGGGACEDMAIRVGSVMEKLGGLCVQEECRFNGYADAFYIRVLGTFRGAAALDGWSSSSDFEVQIGGEPLKNAISFKAEQAVDQVTGTPLSTSVWTFRIVEEFGRGEAPVPALAEPFNVYVVRGNSVERYDSCSWIACQLENTSIGMRQIRTGVAKSRSIVSE